MASSRLVAFDAEDSPEGTSRHGVSGRQPLVIHREERRFLIGAGDPQRQALENGGVPRLRTYRVQTLYLDTPDLSWSAGQSQEKLRLRQYNNETTWWFEVKSNTQGVVSKERRQVTPSQIDRLGLKPIVMVQYYREEYETGTDALDEYVEGKEQLLTRWLRVTIDHNVTALQVPRDQSPSEAMRRPLRTLATMMNLVLEVKSGTNEVPSWLPLPTEWEGSKSRFSVAALYGLSNMWAPSYNPVVGPTRMPTIPSKSPRSEQIWAQRSAS